jgi:hypothetical protein
MLQSSIFYQFRRRTFVCSAMASLFLLQSCKTRNFSGSKSEADSSQPSKSNTSNVWEEDDVFPKGDKKLFEASEMSEIEKAVASADAKYTREQVCRDYELAVHALALAQAPVGRSGKNYTLDRYQELLSDCPGTYSTVAKKILALQRSLKDFHTGFRAPEIGRGIVPTVLECNTTAVCSGLVGARFLPLVTEQGVRSYVTSYDANGKQFVFRVLNVNGRDTTTLFNEMIGRASESQSLYGSLGSLSFDLFYKSQLDFSTAPLDLSVYDITTKTIGKMKVQFGAPTSFDLPEKPDDFDFFAQFNINRDYGCAEMVNGSTSDLGACLLPENRGLVWIGSFSLERGFPETLAMFRKLVRQFPQVKTTPMTLDLRGNGGGSPEIAGTVACMLGGDNVAQVIARRNLMPSIWPESFELLDGTTKNFSELNLSGNNDLYQTEPGRVASSKNPDPRRSERAVPFFERFKTDGVLNSITRCNEFHANE